MLRQKLTDYIQIINNAGLYLRACVYYVQLCIDVNHLNLYLDPCLSIVF